MLADAADGVAGLAISLTALAITVYLRRAELVDRKLKPAEVIESYPEAG